MKPEALYEEIAEQALPASRYYLILEVGGAIKESGADFQMPPIKYCFKAKAA